jgi:hypothetical protein
MAQNLASKYAALVDERFTEASITEQAVNSDYEWNGVGSVIVYDIDTVPMNDYTASGTNRYGTPSELDNGVQTMLVGMDRAFTFTIDRKNYNDTQMTMEAGKALRRQIDERVIPEVDKYRLAKMLFSAGGLNGTAVTKDNAYSVFLDARAALRNNKVPINGVICFCSTAFYKNIKLDSSFVKASDIAQNLLLTGQVGKIDNIPVIEVPDEYLFGATFILTHPVATTKCNKIEDYKLHDNPQGLNGWLVEGRLNYDAFVRKNKKGAIYGQINNFTVTCKAGSSTTKTKISSCAIDLALALKAGFKLYYSSTGTTQAATTVGTDVSAWTAITDLTADLTTANTYKIAFALTDADGKCVIPSTAGAVVVGS